MNINYTIGFYVQRLLPAGAGAALTPVLFAACGPKTYGEYSLILFLVSTCSLLPSMWISQAALRLFERRGFSGKQLRTIFFCMLASALVGALLGAALLRNEKGTSEPSHLILAAAIFFTSLQIAITPLLQVAGKHVLSTFSETIRIVGPIVILIFLHDFVSIEAAVATSLLIALVAVVAPFAALQTCDSSAVMQTHPENRLQVTSLLRYGLPLSLYSGIAMLLQYLARKHLTEAYPAELAGGVLFAADMGLKYVTSLVTPLVSSKYLHLLESFKSNAWQKFESVIHRLILLIVVIGVIGLLCGAIFLTSSIFPSYHMIHFLAFGISIITNSLFQAAVVAQKVLELSGQTHLVAGSMLVAFVAFIVCGSTMEFLNWLLIFPGVELLVAAASALVFVIGVKSAYFNRARYES